MEIVSQRQRNALAGLTRGSSLIVSDTLDAANQLDLTAPIGVVLPTSPSPPGVTHASC